MMNGSTAVNLQRCFSKTCFIDEYFFNYVLYAENVSYCAFFLHKIPQKISKYIKKASVNFQLGILVDKKKAKFEVPNYL